MARPSLTAASLRRMALVKSKSVPERTAKPGALEAALAQNRALQDQLDLANSYIQSHELRIGGLRRTVARVRGENAELTALCVEAGLIDDPGLYSEDEQETEEEEDEPRPRMAQAGGGLGQAASPAPAATSRPLLAATLTTPVSGAAHAAPLIAWPPPGVDADDISVAPRFDFGPLGVVDCECQEVVGTMGCVCFGLCGDLLKSEFSLANDPDPGGGGFNDDDDWRGTVRTAPAIY